MKKEMLINVLQPEECRIAIVEDGILEELYVERTHHENYTGNIYKGRIVNIEPAIQAAFVDFSVGRNGFLHVSDVEPQYYRRGEDLEPPPRDRDRDRDRRRPPRDSAGPGRYPDEPYTSHNADRSGFLPDPPELPPQLEDHSRDQDSHWEVERPWGPDFDRPDLSEKGRIDRSTPRRFGEGLVEGWDEPPPRNKRTASSTEPAKLSEPSPDQAATAGPAEARDSEVVHSTPARTAPRSAWDDPEIAPPSTIEAELPQSRTARPRRGRAQSSPVPDAPAPTLEGSRSWERVDAPISETPVPRLDEPAPRHRERGPATHIPTEFPPEPRRPSDVGGAIEPFRSDADLTFDAPLEELEDRPRRRGRDAIRARGGERRPGRARPTPRSRPAEPADPGAGSEAGPGAPPRSESSDWGRARQDRAGEPGYVPRRARGSSSAPRDPDLEATAEWLESGERIDSPSSPRGPALDDSSAPASRRRRRRRRRDDRVPGTSETARPGPRDEVNDVLDVEPKPYRAPRGPAPRPHMARPEHDDADFGEHDDDDELGFDEPRGLVDAEPRIIDEEIDPELDEEIRREIEEIYALEQDMGLRATTEARPRRGDEAAAITRGERPRGRGQFKPPIQEIFKRGDEVLIQVIKESIGTKGPTLSTYISIPGRYLVLMPGLNRYGVSRKIADEAQRRRLRDIMHSLSPPKGLGFIVRTAGIDRTKRELARDLAYLLRLWKVILRRIKKAKAPAPIYQESDMIIRTIRDIFNGEIDTIWIDERNAYERAHEFMKVVMPKYVDRVRFYDDRVPLFHRYGLEDEIARIQRRRVDMQGGGSIVIEQTEALVAIDVNSGNFRVEDDAERTAYEMNLRAAKEIARQLRLRDLGGVIVNDFIDMREERHRRGVERALRDAVRRDRARTKILRMSQFGIIEMTRQRIRPSLKRSVYEDCPNCQGAGVAKTAESMAIDVMRLLALAAHRSDIRRVNIGVASAVAGYLNNRKRHEIAQIEADSKLSVLIRSLDGVPAEHLHVECFDVGTNEVRLLPQVQPAPGRRPR